MPHKNKQMLSFFLTTKCNLCCSYCYNADERSKIIEQSLPFEIAKGGVDWYFTTNKSRHIRFYGPGEPMLEFTLLKSIVEYARSIAGDNVTTEIQTNGIFGSEELSWCLDNINIIWLSFDGLPEIQDKYRPLNPLFREQFNNRNSSEILEDNLRWIKKKSGNVKIMVGARVTMTNDNIKDQKKMIDYLYDLGIRYSWTVPLFHSVGFIPIVNDPTKLSEFVFDMESYLAYYIESYEYARSKGMFWGSFLMINFDGKTIHNCRACIPTPHITPDGFLSACDMILLGKNPAHMECFIYGKWDAKKKEFIFFNDKIKQLQERQPNNMSHCQLCEIKYHCAGYCLGEIVNLTGTLYGQNPVICSAIKHLFKKFGKMPPFDYLHP